MNAVLSEEVESKLFKKITSMIEDAGKIAKQNNETILPEYMKKKEAIFYTGCTNNTFDTLVEKGLPQIMVDDMQPKYSKKEIDKFMLKHQK